MIKELLKSKSECQDGICEFMDCSELFTCFYNRRQVCSKHYFELRRKTSNNFKQINRSKK